MGYNCNRIENCYNEGKIQSFGEERSTSNYEVGCSGGICGSYCTKIYNCINNGEIISNISAGGIIGYKYTDLEVVNCYNKNDVQGKSFSGGIIGETMAGNVKIYNSYNQGKISGNDYIGGIAGYKYYTTIMNIYNCYNTGDIEGTNKNRMGEILGTYNGGTGVYENFKLELKKCYYNHEDKNPIGNTSTGEATFKEDSEMKNSIFVDELNSNKSEIEQQGIDVTNWKVWIQGENGYPTFE